MSNTRVAIVTGAARGIGRAIALELADRDCDVLVNYASRTGEAEAVVSQIESLGQRAIAVKADLKHADAAKALSQAALDHFGRIDIVVNNAGLCSNRHSIADTPEDLWRDILDVNLDAVYRMVRAVVPPMRAQGHGHIVNLSSNVTQRMPPSFGAYTVSKAGLEALTKILAREEGPHGIHVNAVAPGPIRTDMFAELATRMGEEKARNFINSVPLGRAGEPREIAAMVGMLVSDTASYVTGQVIYVNGGGPA